MPDPTAEIRFGWLRAAYAELTSAPPIIPANMEGYELRTPPGVYLYSEVDGTAVYVGKTKKKGQRALAHAKKGWPKRSARRSANSPMYYKPFRPRYQAILRQRGLPASDDETMRAINNLHFRCIEVKDEMQRAQLESWIINKVDPLCNERKERRALQGI